MKARHGDIWITADDHVRLLEHLFPGDADEHGAVLHAGIVEGDRGHRLVIRHVEPARDGIDYVAGEHGYRALHPKFIHRQIVACRDHRLAYLAVHNHNCDDRVAFSIVDMASHDRGYPALRDIGKGVPVGALVFGRRSAQADIWLPDGQRLSLGELRVVGPTIRRFYPEPRAAVPAATSLDRQVRMFGAAGQAVLGESRIAVVGLGGVGSLVSEFLARLGVGDLFLIDPDLIEVTNLSRVVGATPIDVEAGLFKTQIALRHLREASKARITCITGDVAQRAVAAQLTQCDYIFLAADSMRARLVANALSHQYLIPLVQFGAKIQSNDEGNLVESMSVVRQVRPGIACLWCNGLIDSTQLANEAKSDEERKRQAYGVQEPNPSVITLNSVAAAHGTNDFLFDFLDLRPRADDDLYRHFHFMSDRIARVAPRKTSECRECVRRLGMGDAVALPCLD